ncbi:unnamed protein product [Larinioides sclopetarius]|uniref:Uncharacterized protein n=1 Tax=Larinioides sclopetarius TaxID=280406 RepID=A0AAV1Z5J3_9ARAC
MQKINAEIKRAYAQINRNRWNELCSHLDHRAPNGKLWNLVKNIGKGQPQVEKCNTVQDVDGRIPNSNSEAANILGVHYQKISTLGFSGDDSSVKRRASNIVHGCRNMKMAFIRKNSNMSLKVVGSFNPIQITWSLPEVKISPYWRQ